MDGDKLLGIYLNDHLAGSSGGLALAKRTLRSNRGTELGAFLDRLVREIDEDQDQLLRVMDMLGVKRNAAKRAGALAAERLGRLKLNGQLTGYSPLSRVVELEALRLGVTGKRSLWINLRETPRLPQRLQGVDLPALVERAERQLEGLEEHRVAAARLAFGAGAPPTA